MHLRQFQLHQKLRFFLEAGEEATQEYLLIFGSLFDIVDEQLTQARYQFEDLLDKSLSKLGIVPVNQRAKDLLTRCSHSIAYSLSIHPFKQFGCCLIADLAAVDRQLSDLPARDLFQAFQEIADSRSLG